ncbi:HNH endonuclease [Poriferisphaera corsica]|uniref:Putative HNH nuclease YajD n=1 Tax=Poriferisphaera corsica TaxID=2528020 RepID=A0A517YU42_9BACT|nr:HNH endonuclease [Poriferisphaera corsica]QDU33764.1 HNH endonuclease [Poriferisphaera corsica]
MPQVFLCNNPGCGARLQVRGWCDRHTKQGEQQATQRHKEYDDNRRNKEAADFYHSKEWREVRVKALRRDNHLCKQCEKAGKLTPATIVHHVLEARERPDLRTHLPNLESVCAACHNRLHGREKRSRKGEGG